MGCTNRVEFRVWHSRVRDIHVYIGEGGTWRSFGLLSVLTSEQFKKMAMYFYRPVVVELPTTTTGLVAFGRGLSRVHLLCLAVLEKDAQEFRA